VPFRSSSNIVLSPVSASFHARDVLAPAAAHLAIGLPLDELGETLEPEKLVQLRIPNPAVEQGRIECEVLDLNRFGNVQLNVRDRHVAAAGLDQLDESPSRPILGQALRSSSPLMRISSPGNGG
jgi:S-adenosyl-L-methionine hydrolase (adenosine-forming)